MNKTKKSPAVIHLPQTTLKKSILRSWSQQPCVYTHAEVDVLDIVNTCCVEFVKIVLTEAKAVAQRDKKKRIVGHHLDHALTNVGMQCLITQGQEQLSIKKKTRACRNKRKRETKASFATQGESLDELARAQERLFHRAKSVAKAAGY